MQMPSMLQEESLTRLMQGAAAGAVATMFVGFYWGGWSLSSTADKMAKQRSELAVVAALAPVCVDKFRALPDAEAKQAALSKVRSWKRRDEFPKELVTLPVNRTRARRLWTPVTRCWSHRSRPRSNKIPATERKFLHRFFRRLSPARQAAIGISIANPEKIGWKRLHPLRARRPMNCRDGVIPLDASSLSKAAAGLSWKASTPALGREFNEHSMQSASCCSNHFGIIKVPDPQKYRHLEAQSARDRPEGDTNLRIPFGSSDRLNASQFDFEFAHRNHPRRAAKNQFLGSQDKVCELGSSRCCRLAVSLLRGGKVPWINGSISHEPGCVPGTKIAVETRW